MTRNSTARAEGLGLRIILVWAALSCLPNWAEAQRNSADLPDSPSQLSAYAKHGEQAKAVSSSVGKG
jgi:hypothetical protein